MALLICAKIGLETNFQELPVFRNFACDIYEHSSYQYFLFCFKSSGIKSNHSKQKYASLIEKQYFYME